MGRIKVIIGPRCQRSVVFLGPVGVGKTTAVRTLSDTPAISTDVLRPTVVADWDLPAKRKVTVGIDYGEWVSPQKKRIALFGAPGQPRFGYKVSSTFAPQRGIVILTYGDTPQCLDEAEAWIARINNPMQARAAVIGLTRRGTDTDLPPLGEILADANMRGLSNVFTEIDPRSVYDTARVTLTAISAANRINTPETLENKIPPHE